MKPLRGTIRFRKKSGRTQVVLVCRASITKSCAQMPGYMTAVRKTIREIGVRKDRPSFLCRDSILKRSVPVPTWGLLRFPPCDFLKLESQFAGRRRSQVHGFWFLSGSRDAHRDTVLFESRAEYPRQAASPSSPRFDGGRLRALKFRCLGKKKIDEEIFDLPLRCRRSMVPAAALGRSRIWSPLAARMLRNYTR